MVISKNFNDLTIMNNDLKSKIEDVLNLGSGLICKVYLESECTIGM